MSNTLLQLHNTKKITVQVRVFNDFKIMQYYFEDDEGNRVGVEAFYYGNIEIDSLPPKDFVTPKETQDANVPS